MIPDEAIDAAARAMFLASGIQSAYDWDQRLVPADQRQGYMDTVRPILEAAAPHMLATITTVEELDALPFGSVILDRAGLSLHKNEFTGWRASNGAKNVTVEMLENEALPATILHRPTSA